VNEFFHTIVEALLRIPGVRFVLGLVGVEWRPLWALFCLAVIFYILNRALHYNELRRARRHLAAELLKGEMARRQRDVAAGMPNEPLADPDIASPPRWRSATPPPPVRGSATVADQPPRGLVIAAVVMAIAACLALMAALRTRAVASASARDVQPGFAADSTFQFRARGWHAEQRTCVGTMEVLANSAPPRRLTLHVLDSTGAVIDPRS
jgi:hypothetical protein